MIDGSLNVEADIVTQSFSASSVRFKVSISEAKALRGFRVYGFGG